MAVDSILDVAFQADARFLKHRPPRIDTSLLAAVALVFDEGSVEISSERSENTLAEDRLKRLVGCGRRSIKRHADHLRGLRT